MTTINDKIMRDKETSISAIFEADKIAICKSTYMIIIYYNTKFFHIIQIAEQQNLFI